ncbi:MAG: TonB-dependent receptor [Flavobacteriales bacterium]|nr:TonB-dependent receptor [Flavobacteriales bacterium]
MRHLVRRSLLLSVLMSPPLLHAQTQLVKGTVKDAETQMPLFGVNIVLMGSDPFLGTTSDLDGRYRLEGVPVGRQALQVSYVGYKQLVLDNILVTAGKEVVVDIALQASVENLGEVVVTGERSKDRPANELAKASARTFSLEEVTRYSGGRNDVARLATNFAGVTAANDARNDIVVRGNSPTGLLWRVEGLPVGTTNHFSTLGTTGGPVSALNTNLLRTSDFITSAFPAEYGNANAAVFDVKFRNGNADKHEFTAQMAAFSGAELMAEGPLNREKQSSYLVSGRYGIAGAAATGTSAIPYYQDLAFKLNFGRTKLGRFELFGMGGSSSIDFIGAEIDSTDLFANPNEDSYFTNQLGLVGLNHFLQLDDRSYLRTTIGSTYLRTTFDQDNYTDGASDQPVVRYRATEVEDREQRYTVSSQYNRKVSPRFLFRAGVVNEVYQIRSIVNDRDNRPDIPDLDGDGVPDYFIPVRDTDGRMDLLQIYTQGEYKFTDALAFTLGLHGQYLDYNDDAMVGPRAALSWQFRPKQRFTLAYGLHGQMVPLPILLFNEEVAAGEFERTNMDLRFQKSHHLVLAYDRRLADDWRVKAETYYQHLFDLPVERLPSSYSAVNEGADFVFTERGSLVNEGTGRNYGVELTIEKFLSRGYYLLTTASLFNSTYKGSDGVERNTGFNNGYVFNTLVGKEWPVGRNGRNVITFDTKFTTSGGRPYSPIDLEATRANGGREVYVDEEAFSLRYDPYLRLDVKMGMRINSGKGRVSHQFFVDLQNVTDRQNIFVMRYNPVTDRINPVYQNGFFPDFMYRIQF